MSNIYGSEVFDKLHHENFKSRNEYKSKVTFLSNEKDKWKQAFQQQRDAYGICKIQYEHHIKSIKQECENILIATRKAAEKHFNNIVKLYEESRQTSNHFEKELKKHTEDANGKMSKILELANLLDTLQTFDIKVEVICQNTAEALRSLYKKEDIYADKLQDLRQLTYKFNKKNDTEQNLLRLQNSVLRDIVKDLKRKLEIANAQHASENKLPETDTRDSQNLLSTRRICCEDNDRNKSSNYGFGQSWKHIESVKNSKQTNHIDDPYTTEVNNCTIDRSETCYGNASKSHIECDSLKEFSVKSNGLQVETFETHFNGIVLLEHILHLATAQEIKLKYSPILMNENAPMKVEFLDDDTEYLDISPTENTIYVFLRQLERVVRMKNNGVNCGVQTRRKKCFHNYAQTTVTSVNAPSRLNVASTMLNSEKRAIERSLGNLERTVADLKFNSADKAKSLMEKNGKFSTNKKILEYIRLLTH